MQAEMIKYLNATKLVIILLKIIVYFILLYRESTVIHWDIHNPPFVL